MFLRDDIGTTQLSLPSENCGCKFLWVQIQSLKNFAGAYSVFEKFYGCKFSLWKIQWVEIQFLKKILGANFVFEKILWVQILSMKIKFCWCKSSLWKNTLGADSDFEKKLVGADSVLEKFCGCIFSLWKILWVHILSMKKFCGCIFCLWKILRV